MARPCSSPTRPDRPGAGRYRNQRLWETRLSTAASRAESRRMFEGFRSRWSSPAACTAVIAAATGLMSSAAARGGSGSSQPFLQAPSRHEFQHQVQPAVGLVGTMNLDDVRVAEPG